LAFLGIEGWYPILLNIEKDTGFSIFGFFPALDQTGAISGRHPSG
jgi:hypothetical protein